MDRANTASDTWRLRQISSLSRLCALPFTAVQNARLDETPLAEPVAHSGETIHLRLPAHALRTLLLR